jgi:hypothetical protein
MKLPSPDDTWLAEAGQNHDKTCHRQTDPTNPAGMVIEWLSWKREQPLISKQCTNSTFGRGLKHFPTNALGHSYCLA